MRAARVDANQKALAALFRQAGATVQHLHAVGQGCPDLLLGYRGRNYLVECKAGRGRLTPAQERWLRTWNGQACVIRGAAEALQALGIRQAE